MIMKSGEKTIGGLFAGNEFAIMVGKELVQEPKNIKKLIEAYSACGRKSEPNLDEAMIRKKACGLIGVFAAAHDYLIVQKILGLNI